MASALSTVKLAANAAIATQTITVDHSTAVAGTYYDLRDYGAFAVVAIPTVLGGTGVTKLEIVASDASDGSTNVTVIKDSGAITLTTVAKGAFLECTAEEIAQLGRASGYALRYVAARVTANHAGDDTALVTMRLNPKFAAASLTPATW